MRVNKTKKLVCGVGINDADYVVMKQETIGYEGANKNVSWFGFALSTEFG